MIQFFPYTPYMKLYDKHFCCMECYDNHFSCMEVKPGFLNFFGKLGFCSVWREPKVKARPFCEISICSSYLSIQFSTKMSSIHAWDGFSNQTNFQKSAWSENQTWILHIYKRLCYDFSMILKINTKFLELTVLRTIVFQNVFCIKNYWSRFQWQSQHSDNFQTIFWK